MWCPEWDFQIFMAKICLKHRLPMQTNLLLLSRGFALGTQPQKIASAKLENNSDIGIYLPENPIELVLFV